MEAETEQGGYSGWTFRRAVAKATALSSAWDGAHLRLGAYHLWVDATGDLRIKSGAPTSDTDGTVVGSQS